MEPRDLTITISSNILRKTSVILFLFKIIKIPISLYSYTLIAHLFGVSLEKDQWLLAYSIIIIIDLAIWGPINEVFRVKFITVKEKDGESTALKQVQSLLFYIFVFSVAIVFFIMLKPEIISSLLAPEYTTEQLIGLNSMIKVVAPILIINQATLIGVSILNAYNIFYVTEIASSVSQVLGILILLLTSDILGIYSLVLSTVLGLVVLLVFVIANIKRLKIDLFSLFVPRISDFLPYFVFALPLFVPYFIGQINNLVEKRLISNQGVGAVSIIDFAKKFPDMFSAVISSVLITVLIPVLAKAYVQGDSSAFSKNFSQIFSIGVLGLSFVVVFMVFGSEDLMCFFYGNSDISANDLERIANLNILYSFSMVGVFLYTIFSLCLLSIGKNKRSAFTGAFTQVIVILINILLVSQFGITIFPLSILIAHIASGIYMFIYYPYSKKNLLLIFGKILLTGIMAYFALSFFKPSILEFWSNQIVLFRLFFLFGLQSLLFFLIGYAVKIEEFHIVVNRLGLLLKSKS